MSWPCFIFCDPICGSNVLTSKYLIPRDRIRIFRIFWGCISRNKKSRLFFLNRQVYVLLTNSLITLVIIALRGQMTPHYTPRIMFFHLGPTEAHLKSRLLGNGGVSKFLIKFHVVCVLLTNSTGYNCSTRSNDPSS